MKKLIILLTSSLFVFALTMSFASCGDDETTGDKATTGSKGTTEKKGSAIIDNGAEITILGDETFNFEEVVQGQDKHIEFIIQNTGKGDLIITNAKASCGCTQLEYPKENIKPGNKESISVTFNSNKTGKQKKSITLTTNATPNIKTLYIEGTVLPAEN